MAGIWVTPEPAVQAAHIPTASAGLCGNLVLTSQLFKYHSATCWSSHATLQTVCQPHLLQFNSWIHEFPWAYSTCECKFNHNMNHLSKILSVVEGILVHCGRTCKIKQLQNNSIVLMPTPFIVALSCHVSSQIYHKAGIQVLTSHFFIFKRGSSRSTLVSPNCLTPFLHEFSRVVAQSEAAWEAGSPLAPCLILILLPAREPGVLQQMVPVLGSWNPQ